MYTYLISGLGTVIYTLILLLQFTAARIQIVQPGGDGNSYGNPNSPLHDLCLSPEFSLGNIEKILDWNTTEWYMNWTKAELPKHIDDDRTDIEITGAILLGVPNLRCDLANGGCRPLATCEDIGAHMNLNDSTPISEPQSLELRRRYSLSLMLHYHSLYLHETKAGLEVARDTIDRRADEIVNRFTTTKESTISINQCRYHRAMITAAVNAIFVVLFEVAAVGSAVIWPENAVGSLITSKLIASGFAAAIGFTQQASVNLGYNFHPDRDGLGTPDHEQIPLFITQLAQGTCNGIQDQADLNMRDIARYTNNLFTKMIETIDQQANYFGSYKSKATIAKEGQTVICQELNKSLWSIVWQNPNFFQNQLAWKVSNQLTEHLVSEGLRSSQCYIQCSEATKETAEFQCNDASRINNSKMAGSDHDLATFCPTHEFCRRESLFDSELELLNLSHGPSAYPCEAARIFDVPNLVCRFACLNQDAEDFKPIWPASLKYMSQSTFPMDPHTMFTDAVIAYKRNLGYFYNLANEPDFRRLNMSTPAFRLPVCISDTAFNLKDPIDDAMRENDFEFLCGDWTANETKRFLNEMPLGPDSENWKNDNFQDLYAKYMSTRMDLDIKVLEEIHPNDIQSGPLTYYLAFCEAGVSFRWGKALDDHRFLKHLPEWFRRNKWKVQYSPKDDCENIKAEIKDMDPMEATFWFCFRSEFAAANSETSGDHLRCQDFISKHIGEAREYYDHISEEISSFKVDPKDAYQFQEQNPPNMFQKMKNSVYKFIGLKKSKPL